MLTGTVVLAIADEAAAIEAKAMDRAANPVPSAASFRIGFSLLNALLAALLISGQTPTLETRRGTE
jgi:hypothetical protein